MDLRTAARATLAWADMIEEIGHHYDPLSSVIMELESAKLGSQKLKAAIRSLVGDPKAAIRTAVVSALIFLAKDTITWSWEKVLEWVGGPDAPAEVQSLSKQEIEALAKEVAVALEKQLAGKQARRVFNELAHDENVTGAAISSSDKARPESVVPRSEFPPEVYIVEETGHQIRRKTEQVELVLLRPILTSETNRRWGFAWPHGKIGAAIKDQGFLDRMASGALNIQMAQGIVFTVDLEIIEELHDSVWTVKEYNVERVIHIEPPSHQGGLDLE